MHSPDPPCYWSWSGGLPVYTCHSKEAAPSRDFTELEFAADDDDTPARVIR